MNHKFIRAIGAALATVVLVTGCSKGTKIVPIESLSPVQTAANVYTPAPSEAAKPTPEPIVLPRIEEAGMSLGSRINPPLGFARVFEREESFAEFMRKYPLRMAGAQVLRYDGEARQDASAAAVLDVTLGKKNHEGPAGAVARLYAEYLFSQQEFDEINFTLGSDFEFTFDKWRQGKLLKAEGNKLSWIGGGEDSNGKDNFKAYLSTLFVYISMDTLKNDMRRIHDVDGDPIAVGDIFIGENSEGKQLALMVADICQNDETGERMMLLVQGGSPAQQLHVVDNPYDASIAPWYSCEFDTTLKTPDVTVDIEDRYRFRPLMKDE